MGHALTVLSTHWIFLLCAIPIATAGVGWLVEMWATPRQMNHRYGHCPGCGSQIVRARCADGENRFFDSDSLQFADPHIDLERHGQEDFVFTADRRLQAVRRARDGNAQLWVFNPRTAVVKLRNQHVRSRQGLTEHHCALNPTGPTTTEWNRTISWTIPRDRPRS